MLSLGEQQRINFARLLLQPPGLQLALIDEGTSACDVENEGRLYAALQQRLKSFVSVGHRPALRRYHTHALVLQRDDMQDAVNTSKHGLQPPSLHTFLSMPEFESRSSAV